MDEIAVEVERDDIAVEVERIAAKRADVGGREPGPRVPARYERTGVGRAS